MESEDLDEKVQWECRRIAAAFGVEEWEKYPDEPTFFGVSSIAGQTTVCWVLEVIGRSVNCIRIALNGDTDGTWCDVFFEPDENKWYLDPSEEAPRAFMARGVYRLGLEDEGVLSQLPELNEHEKLELRLSMPREFWPKKWLDEEGE